jgi:hypothetical protein
MCQRPIDDKNAYNAGNDTNILFLAFFTFGNIDIEDTPQTHSPCHPSAVIRFDDVWTPSPRGVNVISVKLLPEELKLLPGVHTS